MKLNVCLTIIPLRAAHGNIELKENTVRDSANEQHACGSVLAGDCSEPRAQNICPGEMEKVVVAFA